MASGERHIYRPKPTGFLSTSGTSESATTVQDPIYEGIVVDVILDHTHHQYSNDGYNVGAIKVRIFSIHNGRDQELLDWADPLDSTIQEMPLLGEIVVIHKVFGNFFYMRKVFLSHRMQENAMLKMNDLMDNRSTKIKSKVASTNEELTLESHKFGDYFRPDSRVRQLKHFEGDVIIQGRMGNSIRFGSSQIDPSSKGMAPNLLFRTGQAKDVENTDCTTDKVFGLIVEDINKDVSSIWMTSDQVVPYEPTTVNAGSFYRSVVNPPQKYDGGQIIINSDRLLLGSKKTHIMMFAHEEIHLNSFKRTSIDTNDTIFMTANIDISQRAGRNIDYVADNDYMIDVGNDMNVVVINKHSLIAKKTYLGTTDNDKEPMVGGTTLSKFLARLILTLMGTPPYPGDPPLVATPGVATGAHVLIANVIPGVLNPTIVTGLTTLFNELVPVNGGQEKFPTNFAGAPFNSIDNFIKLANDTPLIENNNFSVGDRVVIENNKWVLTDSYYKVV